LLFLLSIGQAQTPTDVGRATLEVPVVLLLRGQSDRPIRLREPIRAGDLLRASDRAKATVYLYATREVWRLPAKSWVVVGAKALTPRQGPKPVLLRKLAPAKKDPTRSKLHALGTTVRGPSGSLSPAGAVRRGPAVLRFIVPSWATSARLQVLDLDGKEQWATALDADAKSFTVPKSRLPEGHWKRVRLTYSGPTKIDVTEIPVRILSGAERRDLASEEQALKRSLAGEQATLVLSLADLYADYGLADELANAVALAYPSKADVGEAARLRAELLERIGLVPEALRSYIEAWRAGLHEPELKVAIERLGGVAPESELNLAIVERDRLIASQKLEEALVAAERVVGLARAQMPDSAFLGVALQVLADLQRDLQSFEASDKNYRASIAAFEKAGKAESLEAGLAWHGWGTSAYFRNQLDDSETRWKKALAVRKRVAPISLDVAKSLNNLGVLAVDRGNLDEAQRFYEASLAIDEQLALGSLGVAASLNNLGNVAWSRGDLEAAQRRYKAALVIKEKLAPGSLDVASSLSNLGNVASDRGDLAEAQRLYEEALAIQEKLNPGSLDVARSLNNLGTVAYDRGDFVEAKRLYDSVLPLLQKLAPGSLAVARTLNNQGIVAHDCGDLASAQSHYEAALEIFEKLAPGSLEVASIQNNMGSLARNRGDLVGAQLRYETALAIKEQLAPGSLEVAVSLSNLGNVAHGRGDLAQAQRLLLGALAIEEKLAPGSLGVAGSLSNLGVVMRARGNLDEAKRMLDQALAIYEKLAPGSLDVARSLGNLGNVAHGRGNLAEAQRLYEAALAIEEKLAPGSQDIASILGDLGTVVLTREGRSSSATLFSKHRQFALDVVSREAGSGEAASALAEASRALRRLGWLESPASEYSALPTLRGIGLAIQTRQNRAAREAQADPEIRKAYSAVMIATKSESDWASRPRPKELDEKQYMDRLLKLRSERQSAELKLSEMLRTKDPRLARPEEIALSQVQAALPQTHALVEYLRVSTWDDQGKKQGPDAYVAFVVAREGEVRYVPLRAAEEIDPLVQDWHMQIALSGVQTEEGTAKELERLGRMLYDKLVRPLGTLPPKVLLSPDWALHRLPFGALVDDSGKFLVETHEASLAGSGRDLVEPAAQGKPGPTVVVGGPQFDLSAADVSKDRGVLSTRQSQERAFGADGRWDALPGAATEAQAIAKLLEVEPVMGDEATEERLLSVQRPLVLHIATHGFFFPPPASPKRRESMLAMGLPGQRIQVADSPMIRSGLVLAGANDDEKLREQNLGDGWVTALELSMLDLAGTELVALSACDTGRGEERDGEGVFGLQRAFRFAGAKTLVMSLFKVPDDSSRRLFEKFYGIWKPGMPSGSKLAALRQAQLEMLKDPKTRHPKHWSGFVLMGER